METRPDQNYSIEALTEKVDAVLLEAGDLLSSARIGVAEGRISPATFLHPDGAIVRAEVYGDQTRVALFVRQDETLDDNESRPTELVVLLDERAPFRIGAALPPDVKRSLGGDSFQMVTISNCAGGMAGSFPRDERGNQKKGFVMTVKHRVDDTFLALNNIGAHDDPATNQASMAFLDLVMETIEDLKKTATERQSPIFRPGIGHLAPALAAEGDPGDHDHVRAIDARTGRAVAGTVSGVFAPVVTGTVRDKKVD